MNGIFVLSSARDELMKGSQFKSYYINIKNVYVPGVIYIGQMAVFFVPEEGPVFDDMFFTFFWPLIK